MITTVDCKKKNHSFLNISKYFSLHMILFVLFVFSFLSCFCNKQTVSAESIISDSAGLFTTKEAAVIKEQCDVVWQRYHTTIFLITSDSLGSKDDLSAYMDKQTQKEEATKDLIILFIGTKDGEETCQIKSYGKAAPLLKENRINSIIKDMEHDISRNNYVRAADTFRNDVLKYLGTQPFLDHIIFQSIPQLIFCIIIACCIMYLMLRNIPAIKELPAANSTNSSIHSQIDVGELQCELTSQSDEFTHAEELSRKKQKKEK